jgi:hypothetical protein
MLLNSNIPNIFVIVLYLLQEPTSIHKIPRRAAESTEKKDLNLLRGLCASARNNASEWLLIWFFIFVITKKTYRSSLVAVYWRTEQVICGKSKT